MEAGISARGVAVVKSHYPFARAYDLAEELCASAKKRVKELRRRTSNRHRAGLAFRDQRADPAARKRSVDANIP